MRHMCLCVCVCTHTCVHVFMCMYVDSNYRGGRGALSIGGGLGGEKRRGKPQRVSGGAKIIQQNTLSNKGFFLGFSIILKNSLQVSSCL